MVKLHITNLDQFAAQLKSGATNLAKETHKELSRDAEKFFRGLAANVERSQEYQDLRFNQALRGKLGLARQALKSGGDTDAEDLLELLRRVSIKRRITGKRNVTSFSLPSLTFLEAKLTHRLTKVNKGSIQSGPIHSWFRWWEFGDRGEINSLTILRQTISKLVRKGNSGNKKSRTALLQILKNKSRSGEAIQVLDKSPDQNSNISPTRLIGRTYSNFARIFPAVMGKSLRRFTSRQSGRAERFFGRQGA
jgi:hypothetical protein